MLKVALAVSILGYSLHAQPVDAVAERHEAFIAVSNLFSFTQITSPTNINVSAYVLERSSATNDADINASIQRNEGAWNRVIAAGGVKDTNKFKARQIENVVNSLTNPKWRFLREQVINYNYRQDKYSEFEGEPQDGTRENNLQLEMTVANLDTNNSRHASGFSKYPQALSANITTSPAFRWEEARVWECYTYESEVWFPLVYLFADKASVMRSIPVRPAFGALNGLELSSELLDRAIAGALTNVSIIHYRTNFVGEHCDAVTLLLQMPDGGVMKKRPLDVVEYRYVFSSLKPFRLHSFVKTNISEATAYHSMRSGFSATGLATKWITMKWAEGVKTREVVIKDYETNAVLFGSAFSLNFPTNYIVTLTENGSSQLIQNGVGADVQSGFASSGFVRKVMLTISAAVTLIVPAILWLRSRR